VGVNTCFIDGVTHTVTHRDRRSLGSSQKPSGVLIGHTEGITNVSAKGDGRYVISNGKDQALRLWDLRKMRTNEEYEEVANISYGIRNYDYRYYSALLSLVRCLVTHYNHHRISGMGNIRNQVTLHIRWTVA
jgi:WD40 repeat protein